MIVLTPKSMLRNKAAVSPVAEFTTGAFQSIINDCKWSNCLA
jgi:2-oxoglutarate decarboxylase